MAKNQSASADKKDTTGNSGAPTITSHKPGKKAAEPKETEFVYGNIIIPVAFEINRERFEKMYKGKVRNLDAFWVAYQAWCKKNK